MRQHPANVTEIAAQKGAPPQPKYFVIEGKLKTLRHRIGVNSTDPAKPSSQLVCKIRVVETVSPEVLMRAFRRMTKPKIRIYEGHIPRRRDQFVVKSCGPLTSEDNTLWVTSLDDLIGEIIKAERKAPYANRPRSLRH